MSKTIIINACFWSQPTSQVHDEGNKYRLVVDSMDNMSWMIRLKDKSINMSVLLRLHITTFYIQPHKYLQHSKIIVLIIGRLSSGKEKKKLKMHN